MKNKVVRFFHLVLFVAFAFTGLAEAQAEPFKAGETLTYEGKFSKSLIRGISVADLVFSLEKGTDSNQLQAKAMANSKGTLVKLFRFSFFQNIQSIIDLENFRALKTTKRDEQGERVRDSEASFDYRKKEVTYIETDPKDMARPPRKIASSIEEETHDIISGIYALRRLPLAVGKVFELTVSDSGLVYKVPVRVTKREQQSSVLGKVWCFRVEPEVFGAKRFIESKGSMVIWITDDARRIPIRSQITANVGKIEVKLKKAG